MHGNQRVIFLEFNELCPSLLERWMAAGLLPNFRRFHTSSQVFTAASDDSDPNHLEPWIQWYSLHTGLPCQQHGVFHLTDGPKAGHPDVWQLLRENGVFAASCASMNTKGFRGGFHLPDPWCTTEPPDPPELAAFHKVIAQRVQENSSGQAHLSWTDYCRFCTFLIGHGLSLNTVAALGCQLWGERTAKHAVSWKRVVLLDKLQFDVFRHYWRVMRPGFSTFFLNSTAHYQHAYWHHMAPENFPHLPADPGSPYRDAVLFGYQQMDGLLERFFEFERAGALLVLATALSQQGDPHASSLYYRPRQIETLLARLGISCQTVLPVMAHQYSLQFVTPGEAAAAKARLASVVCEGKPVFDFGASPSDTVFFGNALHRDVPASAVVQLTADSAPAPFYDVFYKVPHMKTGIHHPDSVLWFKTGRHQVHREKASILDVLPTILDMFGVTRERGRWEGRSLLPAM